MSPCVCTVLWKAPPIPISFHILLLQSALQPSWVMACLTIVEYSQQEGFLQRHVKPPQNWRTSDLERSNSRHQVSLTSQTTRANPSSGRWNYGREISENFCRKWRLPRHFWVLLHLRKFTTWDRRLYFPSEGRRAEDFFARKIRRLRPGLNPRTWVPKTSTLTSRPPKPLISFHITINNVCILILCVVSYTQLWRMPNEIERNTSYQMF